MEVITLSETIPITVDRNVMSGTPVFRGTRVPVRTLFDYIADGNNIDEFLDNFPTVTKEQVLKLLDLITTTWIIGVPAP